LGLGLILLACWLWAFMWPRFLVPPHIRGQPGWAVAVLRGRSDGARAESADEVMSSQTSLLLSAESPEPLDLSGEMAYARIGLMELGDALAKRLKRFVLDVLAAHPRRLPARDPPGTSRGEVERSLGTP
jgi:hypothetical protein